MNQEQMLAAGYNSGDPVRRAAAIAAGYVPPVTLPQAPAAAPTQYANGLPPDDPSNKFNTATGQPNANYNDGSAPALPTSSTSSGSLVAFSNALNAAVNLARQHRNTSSLGLMAPFQGTAKASDFDSILNNLNTSSDKTSSDLIATAEKAATPTEPKILGSASSGYYSYDPVSGAVTPIIGSNTSVPATSSGMTSSQVTALKNALNTSKFQGSEADGKYADPNLYLSNYNSWIASGGSAEEFLKEFPPATYINPANTFLPPEIMQFVKKPAASTSGSNIESEIDSLPFGNS